MTIVLALVLTGVLLASYALWITVVARRAASAADAREDMLDQIHDAVIIWRIGAGITEWNRGAEALYGWSHAQAVGRPVHELLATRISGGLTPADLEALLEQRGVWSGELLQRARDASEVWVETRMVLVRRGGGPPTVVETNYDVTARRRAERARAATEARTSAVADAAPDAIVTIDGAGLVRSFNPAAERIFGYRADEILGRNVSLLMPEAARSEHDGYLARYHRTGERRIIGIGREVSAMRKDGSVFPADLAVGEAAGEERLYAGILRDISDRKAADAERERLLAAERAARAEADRAARLKDEFLAVVSHELRTPLTAILGWAGLLRAGDLDAQAAATALGTIERNARVQAQLVDDLLDVGRIVAGKLRVELRPTDLVEVVQGALWTVQPAAEVRRIRLEQDLPPEGAAVFGDPERLQQVVWNLLSNAVKFTPEGGTVHVGVRRVGARVEMAVRDTGIGIPADLLPHLFERFWQADASLSRARQRGLGLGLALVRHLVELHGGEVRGESEGQGRGTTFTVSLPAAATVAVRAPRPASPAPHALAGVRVLVVDDEPDVCALVRQILERSGAEVHTAASADEALSELRRCRPDVLVADLGMPLQDGFQLARSLRAMAPEQGGRTPAAALTALARPEDRAHALAAGYQVHIAKPVDAGLLVHTIAGLAGRVE